MTGGKEFDPGDKVQRVQHNLEQPSATLKQIGALMVAESQRAFREQRFGKDTWRPRASVNVFGILADFAAGRKAPPARRFEPRPALRDTGRLASSISFRLVSDSVVEVGTNVEYAAVHQTGGTVESEKITPDVQSALWAWLKGRGKDHKDRLGWLLNRKYTDTRLTAEVPARPFIGVTDRLQEYVRRAVGVNIVEAD